MSDTADSEPRVPLKVSALKSLPVAVLLLDDNVTVRWANNRARDFLAEVGPAVEIEGLFLPEIPLFQEVLKEVTESVCEAVRHRRPLDKTVRSSLGDLWHVMVYQPSAKDESSSTFSFLYIDRVAPWTPDAHTLKANVWHELFEAINHPVIAIDGDHVILAANKMALAMLGVEAEEAVVGHHCYHLIHGTDSPPDGCPGARLLASKRMEPKQAEMTALGRKVIASVSPVFDTDGALSFIVHSFQDVTDRRAAEEAANLYLDVIGHDVANIIQSIEMAAWLIEQECPTASAVSTVREAAGRINRLIQKSRAIESLAHSSLHPIVLQDAVLESLDRFVLEFSDVVINASLPEEAYEVNANHYISVILDNLLDNAVRHNSSAVKEIWVTLRTVERGYELVIADNGPGLDDTARETVLNGSRHFGGMGIHQARIVSTKFGASIRIEDRVDGHPNEGSAFVIWFPSIALLFF